MAAEGVADEGPRLEITKNPKPPDFSLPSAKHLTDLTVFYDNARFNKDGSATVSFKLPAEMKVNVIALSDGDGMALNMRVWETRLPDGMEELARVIGLTNE